MSESASAAPFARLAGKGGRYHHGRLRGALLVAAAQILEDEGESGLTLRALAGRAGVSRTAPYRHFADKQALLAAVTEQGFRVLDEALSRAASGADDPFRAMGRAYLAFARRHHPVFRLMFADPALDESVCRAGEAALMARFAGLANPLAARALVHGLATVGRIAEDADEGALDRALEALAT